MQIADRNGGKRIEVCDAIPGDKKLKSQEEVRPKIRVPIRLARENASNASPYLVFATIFTKYSNQHGPTFQEYAV